MRTADKHHDAKVAHAAKPIYHRRMSEQEKLERDIDEVLASIDAMLAQKDKHTVAKQEKDALIEHASVDSTDSLSLSSTPPLSAIANDEGQDDDSTNDATAAENITSPHRILLTEALLAPTVQETIPLWVEQGHKAELKDDSEAEASLSNQADKNPSDAESQPSHDTTTAESSVPEAANADVTSMETTESANQPPASIPQQAAEPLADTAEKDDAHILTINRDQLEQLVEVISRDVSRQLNQQMQELLPRLISASLVRHIASLKKDNS